MQDDTKRKSCGLSLGAMLPALGVALTWFCCLPIAAGALGAGAATIGVVLTPLRLYLAVLAVALLGLAFSQAYKPRRKVCSPAQSCALPQRRTRQRVVLWLITLCTLALLTMGAWSSWVIYWTL